MLNVIQYRYAQQQRSRALAAMSEEDRQAWFDSVNETQRTIGYFNDIARAFMDAAFANEDTVVGEQQLNIATCIFKAGVRYYGKQS
ncbi:MAG: hypothetical protein ACWGQW_02860 [bacterium]